MSGGTSVFSEGIEDTLRKHPDEADAEVIGFKSQAWDEAESIMLDGMSKLI